MTKTFNIEIEEDVLNEAMRRAGTSEPEQAFAEALKEFTKPRSQKDLIPLLGKSDGFFTTEELDRLREVDS